MNKEKLEIILKALKDDEFAKAGIAPNLPNTIIEVLEAILEPNSN